MWKSGTFDLEDINEALIEEIVFFDICYPGMGEPGCVIFLTQRGDEYIISQRGMDLHIAEIIKNLFPNIYDAYRNMSGGIKDEYGFAVNGNWKIIPEFAGVFLVRKDYFDKFYSIYQTESETSREFPCGAARKLFGRESYAPKERMVYIKTQECCDRDAQEAIVREQETEKNRLSDTDVPWMKYKNCMFEGYIKFFVCKYDDGTFSGFRWLIQVQREQCQEGCYGIDAPIECFNLFLKKYENIDTKILENPESFYRTYVNYDKAGDFVCSYKDLEKAKEAVCIRNEWCGWGNVNKKNLYMLDYNQLKLYIEGDSQFYIL